MSVISSLVPARFLTLIAHLVIVITIFWSRVSFMYFLTTNAQFTNNWLNPYQGVPKPWTLKDLAGYDSPAYSIHSSLNELQATKFYNMLPDD